MKYLAVVYNAGKNDQMNWKFNCTQRGFNGTAVTIYEIRSHAVTTDLRLTLNNRKFHTKDHVGEL